MSFLDRLERSLGRFAVPGLIRYVVALNALVFLLAYLNPKFVTVLTLDREAILSGQVWRLLSWIFIPDTFSIIWIIFYLGFLWFLGDILEGTWGVFRVNLYYAAGMFACTASALIFGASGGNLALNSSLLFAAGTVAPNIQIMFMLIIPLQLKWVAVIALIFPALSIALGPPAMKAATVLSFGNYLLFFGPQIIRLIRQSREVAERRAKFEASKHPASETLHRCHACGRTEISNPELDFRVAADGNEYCLDHLAARTRSAS